MAIEIIPQSTDVAGSGNAELLKALKQRKQLADLMAGGGGAARTRQEAAPAFAPQNMGQAAFGYAGVAANALGDRMILEREKKTQQERLMQGVAALKGMAPEHFGHMPDTQLLGLLIADPDLPSKIAQKRYEYGNRPSQNIAVPENGSVYQAPQNLPSGLGPRPGATPAAGPFGAAHAAGGYRPSPPGGAPGGAPTAPSGPSMAGPRSVGPEGGIVFQGQPKRKPGQVAYDEAFGKEVADWGPGGGYAQFNSDLAKLGQLAGRLGTHKQDNKNYSGPIIGNTPVWAGGLVPDATEMKENIQSIVQKNLKTILGAQFTQREAEALADRAYNPRQPEELNQKRVEQLLASMKEAAAAKAAAMDYFERNGGSLEGYNVAWKMNDLSHFERVLDEVEGKKPSRPMRAVSEGEAVTNPILDELRRRGVDPTAPAPRSEAPENYDPRYSPGA